jgi:hypothetical protein
MCITNLGKIICIGMLGMIGLCIILVRIMIFHICLDLENIGNLGDMVTSLTIFLHMVTLHSRIGIGTKFEIPLFDGNVYPKDI